jgi:hypothetical protein
MLSRALLATSLLLLAALAAVPAASADDVDAHVAGQHVAACFIGLSGACNPYSGDLARVTLNGLTVPVPDPCYTTSCF